MTPFTDLIAALEEADYLATDTGKRFALVSRRPGEFLVLELARAHQLGAKVLEVVHP